MRWKAARRPAPGGRGALSVWSGLCLWLAAAAAPAQPGDAATPPPLRGPNVVIVTVDTLRFDRVSFHGYGRPTTPHVDALLERGVRFTQARVPEPLTAPAMVSMLTSLYPHEHGTTRNGLRPRPELPSLAKMLEQRGYRTAAFVGNWTLKDQLSGLGEHFASFNEVFTRKRWLGLWFSEATAEDLTREALAWVEDHLDQTRRPFLIWVHYVEPHAPYRFHREFAATLGIDSGREATASDRYDTEVAFVDRSIGDLIAGLEAMPRPIDPLIVFTSDHGESLGEHNYWGHGRNLYEPTLRIPLGLAWEGRIEPQTIDSPASLLDLTPTVLGLIGLPVPTAFRGFDWSRVFAGDLEPPVGRVTHHQAHKGAVQGKSGTQARRQGLLEVGRVSDGRKEILRVKSSHRRIFDLGRDAAERDNLAAAKSEPSEDLARWLAQVREGLAASDELPPPSLDAESLEQLRALGYLD